ncbi:hypothetical protein FS749_003911, partial [Ceratobasidium sp. UAMH 11750]
MPPKKRTNPNSQKSQKDMSNHSPPESVALPFREAHANRVAERAAKKGKAPPPPAAVPTIQHPRRNIVEKTYDPKYGPVPLNCNNPIVDPDIPALPGQEDIPPSPKGSSLTMARDTQVTPNTQTDSNESFETSAAPTDHPFGQPESQADLNFAYGNDDSAILRDNTLAYGQLDFSGANWPGPALGDPAGLRGLDCGDPQANFQPLANSMPLPSTTPNFCVPNLASQSAAAPQPSLGEHFNFMPNTLVPNTFASSAVEPSAAPVAQLSFLEQLGHNPDPGFGLGTSPSMPQYTVGPPLHFQTPTPVRTVSYQQVPVPPIPSYYPRHPPIPQPNHATQGLPAKTPSRKNIQVNMVDFFADQRKFRGRKKKPARASSVEGEAGLSAAGKNYDDAKPIIRKAVFFELVSNEPWPLHVGPLRQAVLEFVRSTPGGPALADIAAEHPKFEKNLRDVMANVRGDAYMHSHVVIKQTYDVLPKSKDRLSKLLEDKKFHFLYPNETKGSSKEVGFCCHEAVSRVICAILFDSPARLGTLFMDRLCAFDKPEPWHDERKDKSDDARRGVPIGLIAFAGTLILHVLECVRDDVPGAKRKQHRFKNSRYKKHWASIRTRLIRYKFLGKLRVDLLSAVKARYNEINNSSALDSSDSSETSSSSSDNEDGTDSEMVPEAGPST